MCGIFGVYSNSLVVKSILDGLSKLEYRGYDSSGISILDQNKKIHTLRAKGKLEKLKIKLKNNCFDGQIGIGHTRWATHGVPSTTNAHPHSSKNVSIVHNGIIENYTFLKKKLVKLGYQFNSETDSEVIAHLLDYELKKEEPNIAIKKMLRQLEGAFAIAIIFKNLNLLAGSRKGSPLALGLSDNSTFIG